MTASSELHFWQRQQQYSLLLHSLNRMFYIGILGISTQLRQQIKISLCILTVQRTNATFDRQKMCHFPSEILWVCLHFSPFFTFRRCNRNVLSFKWTWAWVGNEQIWVHCPSTLGYYALLNKIFKFFLFSQEHLVASDSL